MRADGLSRRDLRIIFLCESGSTNRTWHRKPRRHILRELGLHPKWSGDAHRAIAAWKDRQGRRCRRTLLSKPRNSAYQAATPPTYPSIPSGLSVCPRVFDLFPSVSCFFTNMSFLSCRGSGARLQKLQAVFGRAPCGFDVSVRITKYPEHNRTC